MPGGRPPRDEHNPYPELAELADWFKHAISERGHASVLAFVQQHTLDKNKIYDLLRARVLLSIESIRHLAQLLGRDPAEVEPIWLRAREATDVRVMTQDEQQRPRVTSWTGIPRPELALRNVLDALTEAVDQLPYRLLGVAPPRLSTVYVRQMLRKESTGAVDSQSKHLPPADDGSPRGDSFAVEASVSVLDALDRNEHLLITGEPGAGKSTLGHSLVSRIARIWLRKDSAVSPPLSEPVVPVRVPARALVGDGAWSTVLAEALRQALGPYLVTEPSPQLFKGCTHGVRWLVVVDGLDEILDRSARTAVIRTLARHARPGSDYRVIITTRPLPAEEIAPLRGAHIGICSLQPFEQEELQLFAERWFLAQDPLTAETRAAEFLRQVEDSRLKDLVRNPLLATIAAVASTREPARQLPTNRVDLYQRFYDYLVTDEEASGRSTPEELRRLARGHDDRHRLTQWIYSRRTDIVDALARERMTTEAPLVDAARTWVRDNRPANVQLAPGWEEDLDRLLIDTGMFVYERAGIRFLHHTFAEFLAARCYARDIPADFPDLQEWIDRGLKPAQRNFVLLTMVLWGRIAGNDTALILRALTGASSKRSMLAGRLLAESGQVEESAARQVVDKLFDIALGHARHGGQVDVYERYSPSLRRLEDRLRGTADAMEVISLLTGSAYVASRLRKIADSRELDFLLRLIAIATLNRITTGGDEALKLLRSLARSAVTAVDHYLIAAGLMELVSKQSDEARAILLPLVSDPHVDAESLAEIATLLIDLGEVAAAVTALQRVVVDVRANQDELRSAAKLLLEHADEHERSAVSQELAAVMSPRSPQDQVAVAKELMDAGFPDQALGLARTVIGAPDSQSGDLSSAFGIWLSHAGQERIPELLAILDERPVLQDTARVAIAEELAKAGDTTRARGLLDDIISDTTTQGHATNAAIQLWFSLAENSPLDDLLLLLAKRRTMDPWVKAEIADALATAGHSATAADFAREALADPRADDFDVSTSAEAGLRADMEPPEVLTLVEQGRPPTARGRVIAARVLARLKDSERATRLSLDVLGDVRAGHPDLQDAVDVLILANGVAAAEPLLAALRLRPHGYALRSYAADRLAIEGALAAAVALWCEMLAYTPVSPADSVHILNQLVQTGHRDQAVAALHEALAVSDAPPVHRARLNSLLAWATLCGEGSHDGATPVLAARDVHVVPHEQAQ